MNVLIDIEWVKENEVPSITQFAAVRVTEEWKAVAIFERLVCPENHWAADWAHMAYSGYASDEFRTGVSEKTCVMDFIEFKEIELPHIRFHALRQIELFVCVPYLPG